MGIEGDRHATERVERKGYQVLIVDNETLQKLNLEPGVIKEQVTTTGIDVASLAVGQQLALGDDVVIEISKDAPPCSRMEEIRPGLQSELEGQRGMLASIVTGGTVNVGDPIRLL
jgi:MOSC domain-containing protein YiiM